MNSINNTRSFTRHGYLYGYVLLLSVVFFTGCQKFLDEKPRVNDIVPTKLSELQTLLDNTLVMNSNSPCGYAELVADNYYLTTADYESLKSSDSRLVQADAQNYVWEAQALPGEFYWRNAYQVIYYANLVLHQMPLIPDINQTDPKYKEMEASALFYRAFTFYSIAQLWCKPYANENLNEPGIVLRTSANVGEVSTRSTVQETYDKIISDLEYAADFLPVSPQYKTRPSKVAAYSALARVYLSMREYDKAEQYADMALQEHNTLIDYNTLVPVGWPPISSLNQEVIFHSWGPYFEALNPNIAKTDTVLFGAYDDNDLRKSIFLVDFFGGSYLFWGSYHGTNDPTSVFDGLATDELFLIKAECAARAGRKDDALTALNTLITTRWTNDGSWVPFTAATAEEALNIILLERRKELIWRGLRWSDIRRLNLEGADIQLKRIVDGVTYTLPPNDLRTVMLIPWDEINRSEILQNAR